MLVNTVNTLHHGVVSHGICSEMFSYAEQLAARLDYQIGKQQVDVLSEKLMQSYTVKHYGGHIMQVRLW